jgi:hypothetical protein
MSGSFPTSPKPNSVQVRSFEPTLISITNSLKRQARSRGSQRWLLTVNYSPMTRANFAPLYAFSMKQKGQFDTFTFTPPVISTTQGQSSESPVVNGALAVGVTSASIDGLTASQTDILKAGDFFKFSGHSKVYMATDDMDSDGSGDGTLNFAPALVNAVADDETLTISAVPFTVAFTNDLTTFNTDASSLYGFSFELAEVF